MSEIEEYQGRIREFIGFLEEDFIVEECEDQMVEGCMSCAAISARYQLELILETLTSPKLSTTGSSQ